MPTMIQAGLYSATMHLFESDRGDRHRRSAESMAQMRATPINDFFAKGARSASTAAWSTICICFEVKKPEEIKG